MDLARARLVLGVVLVLLLAVIALVLGGVLPLAAGAVVALGLVVTGALAVLSARPVTGDRRQLLDAWDRSRTDLTLLNTQIANREVSQPPRIRRRGG